MNQLISEKGKSEIKNNQKFTKVIRHLRGIIESSIRVNPKGIRRIQNTKAKYKLFQTG